MTWFPRLMTRAELMQSYDKDHLVTKYHSLQEENRRLRKENRELVESLEGRFPFRVFTARKRSS